jgi:hypothetical protein
MEIIVSEEDVLYSKIIWEMLGGLCFPSFPAVYHRSHFETKNVMTISEAVRDTHIHKQIREELCPVKELQKLE